MYVKIIVTLLRSFRTSETCLSYQPYCLMVLLQELERLQDLASWVLVKPVKRQQFMTEAMELAARPRKKAIKGPS